MSMLQYDMTETRFLKATAYVTLPTDGELCAITAALLLVNDAAYSDLANHVLCLDANSVERVAACIESTLKPMKHDIADLRTRLKEFVGLRICTTPIEAADESTLRGPSGNPPPSAGAQSDPQTHDQGTR